MSYEDEARAWAAGHPTRDNGTPWAGPDGSWCGAQTYQFAAFGAGPVYQTASDAYRAAAAAGLIVSTDPAAAGISAIHYWDGGAGHVCQDTRGAGAWLFMASTHTSELVGQGLGFVSFADYQARKPGGITYRGWSYSYGVNTAIRPNPDAGDDGAPNEGEDDMPYILSSGAGQTFITGSVAVNFPSPDDVLATKDVPVVETSIDMHNRILATLNKAHDL